MLTSHTFSLSVGPTPFEIHHDSHKLALEMPPDRCTDTLEKDGQVH